jgi:hypothetical protein
LTPLRNGYTLDPVTTTPSPQQPETLPVSRTTARAEEARDRITSDEYAELLALAAKAEQ